MNKLISLPLLAALALTACGETSFDRGDTRKAASAGQKTQPNTGTPPTGNQTQNPTPNPSTTPPQKNDTIDTGRDEPSLDEMFTGFGEKAKNWLNTTWGSIVNTLKKLPNEVDLGDKSKVYHIGDDNFGGSSDKFRIGREEIKGYLFSFAFQVQDKTANAHLIINNIWGVDKDTNTVSLYQDNNLIKQGNIPVRGRKFLFENLSLQPGQYRLEVESKQYTMSDGNLDRDDIVIEEVKIQTDGKVQALGVSFK